MEIPLSLIRTSKFSPAKISRKLLLKDFKPQSLPNCIVEELFKTGKFNDVARNS